MKRKSEYVIRPIGHVNRTDYGIELCIQERYRKGLQDIEGFSHIVVLWWAHHLDSQSHRKALMTKPPYAPGRTIGVFATRSPRRPNPIGLTCCGIKDICHPEGIIVVNNIDTDDGTPILDIKPYYPVLDRISDVTLPEWAPSEFAESVPDEGVGLE